MSDLADWPRVYCPNCKAIQPMRTERMPADDLNDHEALDLICDRCHFIVATLHALEE